MMISHLAKSKETLLPPELLKPVLTCLVNGTMEKNSMVKSLNKRLGALRKIQKTASFKTRKMIATGIFMSKLIYLMPLWSGCEDYLVRALQVIQNKAARSVSKLSIFTPSKTPLKTCQWMSVRQLMAYHSLVLLHKTLTNKAPQYMYDKVRAGGDFARGVFCFGRGSPCFREWEASMRAYR